MLENLALLAPALSKRTVREQITDRLAGMVRGGLLRPGDALPGERELAAQLAVSRETVRGAIQALAALGLIEVAQGARSRVAPAARWAPTAPGKPRFTPEEVQGVRLLLENMNPEPADAEVRYLACDIPECERFFAALDPEVFGWSFTANHAHMLPVGVEGFYRHFGPARMAEVRLADNRGAKEEHLFPGEGNMDFNALFRLIEGEGYRGHYMLAFGGPDDMRAGRDKLVAEWEAASGA